MRARRAVRTFGRMRHLVVVSMLMLGLAACAVGLARPGDIVAWNPPEREIAPATTKVHADRYALFRRLYEQTKDIARAIGAAD